MDAAKERLAKLKDSLAAKCDLLAEHLDKTWDEKSPTETELKTYQETGSGLELEIKGLREQIDRDEAAQKVLAEGRAVVERLGAPLGMVIHSNGGAGSDPRAAVKSFGEVFTESPAYKAWLEQNAPGGRVPDATGGGRLPSSAPIGLGRSLKTIVTGISTWAQPGNTSGNALVQPRFQGLVDTDLYKIPDMGVAEIGTHIPVESDVIFYVKVDTGTVAAAPTPEATSTSDAAAAKPEGALAFVQGSALVRTIPVWIPITRQALAASGQLRAVIEDYLRYEVMRQLTKEIIQGDGTGEHFLGVEHLANLLSQAVATDNIVTARKAITNLLLNGRTVPTAWCMHPNDWEGYDLMPDGELRYYFGGPRDPGTPRLWGVPVRQSEFVTSGRPLLGDWRRYVVADREATTVRVSDSHSDYFTHNLMAILAELRAAGYAERDQAFCRLAALTW
jgi:HK97 family phage major capsid protein